MQNFAGKILLVGLLTPRPDGLMVATKIGAEIGTEIGSKINEITKKNENEKKGKSPYFGR